MSAFYVKNVPPVERVLRIVIALAIIAGAFVWLSRPSALLVAAGSAGFALTGLLGYCPACAMVGRKLKTAP